MVREVKFKAQRFSEGQWEGHVGLIRACHHKMYLTGRIPCCFFFLSCKAFRGRDETK